jgi:alanine dehydrogenase
VGADAPGKEELDPEILNQAAIFVDDMKQATTSGEINVPLSTGLLNPGRILGSLGEVINGKKAGRRQDSEITVFDSTGIAVEDIACAGVIYNKVKGNKDLLWLNFVD